MTFQTASLFPMNIESARLAELMPAIGGLIQPVAAIQKWQAELSATPLWLLQTLLGVVSIAVCAVFLIGRSRFGREFWQVLKPCMGRRGALHRTVLTTDAAATTDTGGFGRIGHEHDRAGEHDHQHHQKFLHGSSSVQSDKSGLGNGESRQ